VSSPLSFHATQLQRNWLKMTLGFEWTSGSRGFLDGGTVWKSKKAAEVYAYSERDSMRLRWAWA